MMIILNKPLSVYYMQRMHIFIFLLHTSDRSVYTENRHLYLLLCAGVLCWAWWGDCIVRIEHCLYVLCIGVVCEMCMCYQYIAMFYQVLIPKLHKYYVLYRISCIRFMCNVINESKLWHFYLNLELTTSPTRHRIENITKIDMILCTYVHGA